MSQQPTQMHSQDEKSPLVVGVDWADAKHDLCILQPGRAPITRRINAEPQDVQEIIAELRRIASGRPIHVCLEKGRVRIIHHFVLLEDITLYPVDPKQATRFRESFVSSGAKDDRGDAYYLARLLADRHEDMRPMKPDDPLTRKISLLCQTRRNLVDDKTCVLQKLQAALKMYHPLALMLPVKKLDSGLALEFVRRFPDPRKAKKAHRETLKKWLARHSIKQPERVAQIIELIRSTPLVTSDSALIEPLVIQVQTLVAQLEKLQQGIEKCEEAIRVAMAQHPDAKLFETLPGAGPALAPRLLAALGSDRDRYADADSLSSAVGIAPVTIASGKKRQVRRRRACPKFLLQTFHEFAGCARRFCPWSGAYYRWQRDKGVGHHAAIRKLATRWARILFRVWQTRQAYDPARYLESMRTKNHPLIAFLKN
ncbi:IS110 family transposase [Rhodopirellula europaea]|uniref:IS110 family transposase n=1 Tax=Rhodopirellula europaea TaxID=1263866 RepID=UPI003D2BD152